jgi:hypothetical protein
MSTPFRSPFQSSSMGPNWRQQIMDEQFSTDPRVLAMLQGTAPARESDGGAGAFFGMSSPRFDARMQRFNQGSQFAKKLTGYDVNQGVSDAARAMGGDAVGDMTGAVLKGGSGAAMGALGSMAGNALGMGSAAAGGAAGAGGAASGLSQALASL